jgi:aryl-alcohol dehydrogenase-like predicted oxidoreductase
MQKIKRITLGTANLGESYGIANSGEFNRDTAKQIIEYAINLGINSFDTSPSYGIAEKLVGETIQQKNEISFFTKIPRLPSYTLENVIESCNKSLENLECNKVSGVLFHDPDAHSIPGLNAISDEIMKRGIADRIGFSAYSKDDLIKGKLNNPCWTIFQVSENIADRRNIKSGELKSLVEDGNKIQVRSPFLQGLLLIAPDKISPKFDGVRDFVLALRRLSIRLEVSISDLCLSYTNSIPWSDSTIIGAASKDQLKANLEFKLVECEFETLPRIEPSILDPRNWATL